MPYKDSVKRNEIKRRWIERNREKQREYNRKFHANNPDYTAERSRRRRAMERGSRVEHYTVEIVLAKYGTDCHICNMQIDLLAPRSTAKEGWEGGLHIDHLIPISKGGPDTLDNVRPSHGICNIKKGDATKNGT